MSFLKSWWSNNQNRRVVYSILLIFFVVRAGIAIQGDYFEAAMYFACALLFILFIYILSYLKRDLP